MATHLLALIRDLERKVAALEDKVLALEMVVTAPKPDKKVANG